MREIDFISFCHNILEKGLHGSDDFCTFGFSYLSVYRVEGVDVEWQAEAENWKRQAYMFSFL